MTPVRIPQTRTTPGHGNPNKDSYVGINPLATSTGILQVDPTLDHHVHYRETGLLRLANGYSTASREYFLTYADNEVSLFFDRALTKFSQSPALCDWRPGEIVGMAAV